MNSNTDPHSIAGKFANALNQSATKTDKNGDNPYWPGFIVRNWDDGIPKTDWEGNILKSTICTMWQSCIISPNQSYPYIRNGIDIHKDDWGGGPEGTSWMVPALIAAYGKACHETNLLFNDYYGMYPEPGKKFTWGYGIFYPHDANSDKRGIPQFKDWGQNPDGTWYAVVKEPVQYDDGKDVDDPHSLVNDPGNPMSYGAYSAGGAGRHKNIDFQKFLTGDGNYKFLRQGSYTGYFWEANYDLKGNDGAWTPYIDQFVQRSKDYGPIDPSFSFNQQFKADASPWVNNPGDMISLQNALYYRYPDWCNCKDNKTYWGWNELPLQKNILDNAANVDALIFNLPSEFLGLEELLNSCTDDKQRQKIKDGMNEQINYYRTAGCFEGKPVLFANTIAIDKSDYTKGFKMCVFVEEKPIDLKDYALQNGWANPKS